MILLKDFIVDLNFNFKKSLREEINIKLNFYLYNN